MWSVVVTATWAHQATTYEVSGETLRLQDLRRQGRLQGQASSVSGAGLACTFKLGVLRTCPSNPKLPLNRGPPYHETSLSFRHLLNEFANENS